MAKPKIRVYGTAQNRTALGIANAYLKLNPNTTLEQLNEAFPETLFTSNAGLIFANADEQAAEPTDGKPKKDIYFDEPDELLQLKDCKAKMFKTWTKGDYERFVEHAKQYGIIVAEKKSSAAFTKGGYRLADPETDQELDAPTPLLSNPEKTSSSNNNNSKQDKPAKKKSRWWLWLLLIILLIILLLLLLRCSGCCSGCCNGKNDGKKGEISGLTQMADGQDAAAQTDAANAAGQADAANAAANAAEAAKEEVKRTLNEHFASVQFQKGKAEVTAASKQALVNIANKLKEFPDATLKVEGHASKDGSLEFNQRLSEQRAKAIVDFIAAQGVERDRLSYEGKGISMPIDDTQLEANRRVEFIVGNR